MKTSMRGLILAAVLAGSLPSFADVPPLDDGTRNLIHDIYQQLVEIDTTDAHGDTTAAANAMATRLREAGFLPADVQVLAPDPRRGNLVARLRGTGHRKPLLLVAHLDVVEALREDWSTDPFKLVEKDGYYYGRGTGDDKAMAAIWVATLIRLRREGFVPDRDIIVALTADEETGDFNGVGWLLDKHRDLIDADVALNEGGGGAMRSGRYLYNAVGASEKVYATIRLEVKNAGGHSSLPRDPNAIYQLAAALTRLHGFAFPVELSEITRAYFMQMARFEEGQIAADMRALAERADPEAAGRLSQNFVYNARMRTTCVPTRLDAGHADNALPQTARATINCRILPGDDPERVRESLVRAIDDPAVEVTWIDHAKSSVASPLSPAVMSAIAAVTEEFWPGVAVVPMMTTGASDGLYLRNAGIPTYGVSGLFSEIGESRAHGRDERVGVRQFYESAQFLYALTKRLATD